MKVIIQHVNEAFVRLNVDHSLALEVNDKFRFRVPGYQYQPKFKAGAWDGYIRFLNMRNGYFPKGLVPELLEWCEEQEYQPILSPEFERFREKIDFDYKTLNLPFEPYDYQMEAVNRILTKKRQVILASTGAGKSLIAYLTVRAMLSANYRTLIVVPTVGLVSQMAGDFDDYSVNNDFSSEEYVHQICEGAVKETNKPIVVSTWQSLIRAKPSFFDEFDCVICDEVHTASASSISAIMEKSVNAFYRLGLTGTLDDIQCNEMVIKGHFGPVHRVTNTKDLMDRGVLSNIQIYGIILKYPKNVTQGLRGIPYKKEMDFIVQYTPRNQLISKFSAQLKGNTLVLFQYVQKHGKIIHKLLQEHAEKNGKKVFFVYGGTEAEDREAVRKLVEKNDNIIICASIAVYQAGINIKNLHNVVFASSSKSKIRVLQSIGRGLRLHASKDKMRLYDFSDDLRETEKQRMNYTLQHFVERIQIYQREKFPISISNLTFGE